MNNMILEAHEFMSIRLVYKNMKICCDDIKMSENCLHVFLCGYVMFFMSL